MSREAITVRSVSDSEARQRRALRRNRMLAGGLLLLAAALFLASGMVPARGLWLSLVHAGAEAALVGGLADWFAVTALFRHPLGLPIPHTAVLPRNKDRLGDSIGDFVERYFLAPEIVAERLRALAPARRLAHWLAVPENARAIAGQFADALPYLVRSLEDREIRDFAARSFREQLAEADLAPLVGQALSLLTRSGPFDALLERMLDLAQEALYRNAYRLYQMVAERSRWWVPKTIDRRIAEQIIAGIDGIIIELRQPESDTRRQFHAAAGEIAARLVESPEWRHRFNEAKNRLLEQPEVHDWLVALWDELRRIVLDDVAAPRSRTREALAAAALSFGRTLAADAAMQQRLDGMTAHLAQAVVPWRGQIATLISEVVRGWDARTATERIELAVGSDLQYIRMNGTLVGAFVGCLLFLVARFLL